MDQRRSNEYWISSLLKRLDLVHDGEASLPRNAYWKQIEECQLAERIGSMVIEVNRAAGYRVLEMVDFLPPQKNVLRVSFPRSRVKHNLEIVIRESGIVLMFSTTRLEATGWRRYVSIHSTRSRTPVWEQPVYPGEISEQHIQAWVSYLLSGLDKKFRLDQILHASINANTDLETIPRKISA